MSEEFFGLLLTAGLIVIVGYYMLLAWFNPQKVRTQAERQLRFEETTLLPYPWKKPFIKQRKALIKSQIWIWFMRAIYTLMTAFFIGFLVFIISLF